MLPLRVLLLTLHLLSTSLASGVPLVMGLVLVTRPKVVAPCASAWWRALGWAAGGLLIAFGGGLVAGLALWHWQPGYAPMLTRLDPRNYWVLGAELAFSATLLMVVFAARGWWLATPTRTRWGGVLLLLAATNLLYHFPLLMVAQSRLVEQPDVIVGDALTRRQLLPLVFSAGVLTRVSHFWGAALVVAGVGVALAAKWSEDESTSPVDSLVRWPLLLAAAGVVLQAFTGIAAMLVGSAAHVARYSGGNLWATAGLVIAIGLTPVVLQRLAEGAFTPGLSRGKLLVTAGWVALLVLAMALAEVAGR